MDSEETEQATAIVIGLFAHFVTGVAYVAGVFLLSPPDAELDALGYGVRPAIGAEIAILIGVGIAAWVLSGRGRSDLSTRLWLGWGIGIAGFCCLSWYILAGSSFPLS
ncbi:hypothetical protein [Dactylosporangium darangshiense]|uniref:Uncharacterized protein n=1 Tax=Dactylosporangium darangshiense TaxID=579108 RepID=A0ABP8D9E9_9ACTN